MPEGERVAWILVVLSLSDGHHLEVLLSGAMVPPRCLAYHLLRAKVFF